MDYEVIDEESARALLYAHGLSSDEISQVEHALRAHSPEPASDARELAHQMDLIYGMGYATEINLDKGAAMIEASFQARGLEVVPVVGKFETPVGIKPAWINFENEDFTWDDLAAYLTKRFKAPDIEDLVYLLGERCPSARGQEGEE